MHRHLQCSVAFFDQMLRNELRLRKVDRTDDIEASFVLPTLVRHFLNLYQRREKLHNRKCVGSLSQRRFDLSIGDLRRQIFESCQHHRINLLPLELLQCPEGCWIAFDVRQMTLSIVPLPLLNGTSARAYWRRRLWSGWVLYFATTVTVVDVDANLPMASTNPLSAKSSSPKHRTTTFSAQ